MHIRFQRTELVNADPDRLWHILTDYESNAGSNPAVTDVRVLYRDTHGAEVEADRKVFFVQHAHFFETYAAPPLRQLERRYANDKGMRSVWTVEPAYGGRVAVGLLVQRWEPRRERRRAVVATGPGRHRRHRDAFWFLLQLFDGLASFGGGTAAASGVAYWAHVGGFVTGVLLIRPFTVSDRVRQLQSYHAQYA
jgi:ribosome-associated toxin RatA of RatAB toxin-antitoxin module